MFKKLWFNYRLNRKIKQANNLRKNTGYKFMVLHTGNCFKLASKKSLKQLCKIKAFGELSIQDIEKSALYITV